MAGVYLATVAGLAGEGPVLPLYDAGPIAPEPYRWVNPPAEFAVSNMPPEGTKQEVAMTDTGTVSSSILTPDSQAALILREGSFSPRLGEIAVMVEIQPIDPATVDQPLAGARYDGNAYRISATYAKEGSSASLANPASVVLRSPLGGTRLLRHQGSAGWTELSAQPVAASLQVFGEVTQLGVFVAAQTIHAKPFPWLAVSLGASGVAVVAGWAAARTRTRRRRQLPRRDRRQGAREVGRGSIPKRGPGPKRKKSR